MVSANFRYRPPRWLRNPHLQSALSSMPMRRAAGQRMLESVGATTTEHIEDARRQRAGCDSGRRHGGSGAGRRQPKAGSWIEGSLGHEPQSDR